MTERINEQLKINIIDNVIMININYDNLILIMTERRSINDIHCYLYSLFSVHIPSPW